MVGTVGVTVLIVVGPLNPKPVDVACGTFDVGFAGADDDDQENEGCELNDVDCAAGCVVG